MDNQTKIIKELLVLNDFTQGDLISANTELQARIREKNDLQLKFNDSDHETTNLQFRLSTLDEQAQKFEKQINLNNSTTNNSNLS